MKKTNLLFIVLFTTLSLHAQEVWLKDYSTVSHRWSSTTGIDAISEADKMPTLGLINFHPAPLFDGENDELKISYNADAIDALTFFSVFLTDATNETAIWTSQNTTRDIGLTTHQVAGPGGATGYNRGQNIPVVCSITQEWEDDVQASGEAYLTLGAATDDLPSFKGLMPEYLIFEHALSADEKLQVESYLAIKYGITLQFLDYKNSQNQTVWSVLHHHDYYHRIAGIGRDDDAQLYQKQSHSTSDNTDLVTIGIGKIAPTNATNVSTLNDGSFLMWGDDNQSLTFTSFQNDDNVAYSVLHRNWLMNITENTTHTIPTEIRLNTQHIEFPEGTYPWLVIDRSGTGNFAADDVVYVQMKGSVSPEGYAFFDNVQWDTDGSGTDVFTFARGPKPENTPTIDFMVYPNPTNEDFNVSITLDEPDDVTATIFDVNGKQIATQFAENNTRFLFNFKEIIVAGAYEILIKTSNAKGVKQLIIIE